MTVTSSVLMSSDSSPTYEQPKMGVAVLFYGKAGSMPTANSLFLLFSSTAVLSPRSCLLVIFGATKPCSCGLYFPGCLDRHGNGANAAVGGKDFEGESFPD